MDRKLSTQKKVRPVDALLLSFVAATACVACRPTTRASPHLPPLPAVASPSPPERALIGTEHWTVLVAWSRARRWAIICQARRDTDGDGLTWIEPIDHGGTEGDELTQYLVVGSGPGREIDEYVGHDPTGRFVAVIRREKLFLVDASTDRQWAIDSANTDLTYQYRSRGGFSDDGTQFLYFRGAKLGRERVVVHTLATGLEYTVDAGPGLLVDAWFEADQGGEAKRARASGIVLAKVEVDSDHDGKLDFPREGGGIGPRRCNTGGSFYAAAPTGDALVFRAVDGDHAGPVIELPQALEPARTTVTLVPVRGRFEDGVAKGPLQFESVAPDGDGRVRD